MNKTEFLQMMRQDIETEKEPQKTIYAAVIDCMDIVLSQTPDMFDVPADKTVKGAFALIKKRAWERKQGNTACVGPFEAAEIIAEYLGTKYERASKCFAVKPSASTVSVNLDDFI